MSVFGIAVFGIAAFGIAVFGRNEADRHVLGINVGVLVSQYTKKIFDYDKPSDSELTMDHSH
jgi:hypothetical protein